MRAQLIREAGHKAVALPGDIRDENFCKQLVGDAVRELAAVYVTLASQESSYASGQVYGVSGGSGNP